MGLFGVWAWKGGVGVGAWVLPGVVRGARVVEGGETAVGIWPMHACAAWKTRLDPDLEPNRLTRLGDGASIGSFSAIANRTSSGPTTLGTMYAGLPRQKLAIRRNARGEYRRTLVREKRRVKRW